MALSKEQEKIMKLLCDDFFTIKKIAKLRSTSIQAVYKTINKLKYKGYIKKQGLGIWRKIKPPSSLGTMDEKPTTNLHALQINFPITDGKIKDKDWEIKEKLNNWIPKYKKLDILGGLKLKNNNNKSITVFADSRNIQKLEDVDNLAIKIKTYVYDYFKRQGVILDIYNCKTSNLNLATEDKKSESMIKKGDKFELNLKKTAEKIFPKDNINGKAWIDGSPFKFSAETNDKEWKRAYLTMPFNITNMFLLLENMTDKLVFMAKNQESHAGAIKELHILAKNINQTYQKPKTITKQPQRSKHTKLKNYGLTNKEQEDIRKMDFF